MNQAGILRWTNIYFESGKRGHHTWDTTLDRSSHVVPQRVSRKAWPPVFTMSCKLPSQTVGFAKRTKPFHMCQISLEDSSPSFFSKIRLHRVTSSPDHFWA